MYIVFFVFFVYLFLFICFSFIFFFVKKHKNTSLIIDYTVVIPVKNEIDNIIHCINSILTQTNLPKKIIIVDDHSSDETHKVIQESFFSSALVKYIKLDNQESGKKSAIKKGLLSCDTDWVMITDADCVWHKNFSEDFNFDNNKKLISFPVIYSNAASFISKVFQVELLLLNSVGWASMLLKSPFLISGAGMMFKKSDYMEFCEKITTPTKHGDDMFFLEFIKKKYGNDTIQINLSPRSLIFTRPPNNIKEYTHQRARWTSKTPYYQNIISWFWSILAAFIQISLPVALLCNIKFGILLLSTKLLAELLLYSSVVKFFKISYQLLACFFFSMFSWIFFIMILYRWICGFEWKKN